MDAFLETSVLTAVAATDGVVIFCPPAGDKRPSRRERQLSRKVYRWLEQKRRVLFLAPSESSLKFGAVPGPQTLLNPRFLQLNRWVLAQAKAIISFELEPVLFATASGIPSVLITMDEALKNQAAQNGALALETLEELQGNFAENLFCPSFAAPSLKPFERPAPYSLCAMSDWGYASQLVGWLENIRQVEKPLPRLFILTFQKGLQDFLRNRFPAIDMNFVSLSELWSSDERPRLNQLALAKQAFASKGRLLHHVLTQTRQPVFYSDLDILFFRPPSALLEEFGNHSILLFPHWSDSLRDVHRYGMFNAGLLGARPGSERFLKWWSERCLHDGVHDRRDYFYDDQGYLDLVPLYFEPAIYRGKKHNLGPWCRHSTEPTEAVHSFHTSQPDPYGYYEFKALWDQACCLLGPQSPQLRAGLEKAVYLQQSMHWARLNRLYRFTHYLPYRLGLSPFALNTRWQARLASFPLLQLTQRRDYFHSPSGPLSSWVRWQKLYFKNRTELNARFRNSLTRAQQEYERAHRPLEN
ncbi:MAG: hypothetical protein H6617_04280 [Bdellovibrionaceae bacterium]|nr:hypothetical protein [Pseudobdellovibrionaceae bacterium]